MYKFYVLRVYPVPVQYPNFSCWVEKRLDSFAAPLPAASVITHDCDITSTKLLAVMDVLLENFALVDDTYEVLIQSRDQEMLVTNEAGWAIAALTFE